MNGSEVRLTFVEFELLRLLGTQAALFSRRQLLERLRGGADYASRAIDVHVRHLREKIERDPHEPELILTVRGVGYRFRSADAGRRDAPGRAAAARAGARARRRDGGRLPDRRPVGSRSELITAKLDQLEVDANTVARGFRDEVGNEQPYVEAAASVVQARVVFYSSSKTCC